ncbi:hypothetical protein QYM36_017222 [Artemia franciscana]|uniref:YqaJ viral recombinase domain-containing protein n=1 Tax=Artemia franciscana TaxID=6661 RepID=A0AA88HAA0_ARTSF|nr:hypothetical protein QYM36_017222 [Artemia franciscana]
MTKLSMRKSRLRALKKRARKSMTCRNEILKQKKVNEPDGKYGPNATTPDLAAVDFKIMKSAFLQRLECSTEQIQEIEAATRLQGEDDGSWCAVRRDRITASWAGTIAKRRTKIVTHLVQKLLYAPSKVTKAMIYGHTFEPVAAKKFEESTRFKVERCGFFVHYEHGFIGASPDYLVIMPCRKRALLEIYQRRKSYDKKDRILKDYASTAVSELPSNPFNNSFLQGGKEFHTWGINRC